MSGRGVLMAALAAVAAFLAATAVAERVRAQERGRRTSFGTGSGPRPCLREQPARVATEKVLTRLPCRALVSCMSAASLHLVVLLPSDP